MHPCIKFRDPRTIGFALTALKGLSVRALKQKKNKQTGTKLKGRVLHWPKERMEKLAWG